MACFIYCVLSAFVKRIWMNEWMNECFGSRYYLTTPVVYIENKIVVINFSQPTAFRCWSNRMLTGLASSTVRGRILKWDSTTREATTGLATNYCINWPSKVVTSCGVSSSQDLTAQFTSPIMALLSSKVNPATTCLGWLTIPVLQTMQWDTITGRCSRPTTEIMTTISLVATMRWYVEVGSSTKLGTEQV